MIDELTKAIQQYRHQWQEFISERKDTYFTALKPTAVAWKTKDLADFNTRFAELRDQSDCIVLKWMNDRWVAKMHLKQGDVGQGITIVKLMQRRPQSTDAVGLDHVDFYNPQAPTETMLNAEAKLRNDTVIDVTIQDLQQLNQKVIG